jgi:peptide/nickel transport system permease protein
MGRFIVGRLGWLLLTVFIVSVIVFGATQALPGNIANTILGQSATPQSVARLDRALGLDHSLVSQYLSWAGNLLRGNPGNSLASGLPITTELSHALINSTILIAITALLSLPLAVVIGIWSASRRGSAGEELVGGASLILIALPQFVLGILLILLFATGAVHLLPAVSTLSPGQVISDQPEKIILPAATLVLTTVPYLARLVRASASEVLASDYVTMAVLRGVSGPRLLLRHVLPNALVPTVQAFTLSVAYLAGGIVVVESVFNFPGIGSAFVTAVQNRDVPEIQLIAVGLAALYLVLNVLGDVVSVLLTPRLRTEMR